MAEPPETTPLDILVVDDEAPIRRVLKICLESKGHRAECVASCDEAVAAAAEKTFDIAFVDIRLGNESGLDLLAALRHRFPWMRIIIITAHASVESAVMAMRDGASDYLAKPFAPEQVHHAIDKVRQIATLESRVEELASRIPPVPSGMDLLETKSRRMRQVLDTAASVATTDATILIRGESGTGKTMLARRIHDLSRRAAHPFVVVSCPSLSHELLESELFGHVKGSFTGAHRDYAGRIASAQRGTLFLDEIGDMPPSLQAKMLRFIQDRQYESVGDTTTKRADVRIITATNIDLEQSVREGRFREDLLFRLNVIEIGMVPLRERPEDILPIAEQLLAELRTQHNRPARTYSEDAKRLLLAHHWPGNIRELRNVVERCVLLSSGREIGTEQIPVKLSDANPSRSAALPADESQAVDAPASGRMPTLDEIEERYIRRILASCTSLEEAARTLGIDQTTLYRRRKRYGIL